MEGLRYKKCKERQNQNIEETRKKETEKEMNRKKKWKKKSK